MVQEQLGQATLDLIEHVRRTAIRFRRSEARVEDAVDMMKAAAELAAILDGLSVDDTLHVVRAFSCFLQLANIAEDGDEPRRLLNDENARERGTLAHAYERARVEGGVGGPVLRRPGSDRALVERQNAGLLGDARLRNLRPAASLFGFHLASIDLRQSSEKHEAVVADLIAQAGGGDYMAPDETQRIELVAAELRSTRPLRSPHPKYADLTESELARDPDGQGDASSAPT